ncbi:MAG: methyl-accepting chemotaxis protein [Desulfomonilia bacterium]
MKQIKISTKLVALILSCIVGMIVVITMICFVNFNAELKRIATENQETRITVFWDLLEEKGQEIRIVDDKLMVGDYVINENYELPDKVKDLCGGTATVFMRDVRVSTNVMKSDGTRAVGTKLQGAAYDAIFKENRKFRGEAIILGEPYFTAYDPIRNKDGEIIGVLYTGIKRSEFFASFDRLTVHIIVIAAVLAVLVGIGALLLLRSMLTKPINNVVDSLKNIARGEGDLTKRLDIVRGDELGILAAQFNRFIGNLEKIITAIKSTAIHLDTATQEVAEGAQGLSQATQEQASAIEEVAATIEEMTSSIKNNAMHADQGKIKAKEMVAMASASGEASQDLMKAMADISEASKKIGDIIVTVNEVAFQTNLLALNAAVEAARAGEHGKGFAVVADEVRALAQRSADAARQIKDLIEDTVDKVRTGDEIVKRSVESLDQIIMRINELSQTMEEIAASSSEQSTGVDEVSRAIAQIDSSTQQNATTVEELASTSDTLMSEARELASIVERFKVSGFVVKPNRQHTHAGPLRSAATRTRKHHEEKRKNPGPESFEGFEEF